MKLILIMSLNKKLCLRSDSQNSDAFSDCLVNRFESKEDNYRRDSFSDRVCDDLCEDIFQYLSLEDKLRLQCVSKQFQRTIFKRHFELYTVCQKETSLYCKVLVDTDNPLEIYVHKQLSAFNI